MNDEFRAMGYLQGTKKISLFLFRQCRLPLKNIADANLMNPKLVAFSSWRSLCMKKKNFPEKEIERGDVKNFKSVFDARLSNANSDEFSFSLSSEQKISSLQAVIWTFREKILCFILNLIRIYTENFKSFSFVYIDWIWTANKNNKLCAHPRGFSFFKLKIFIGWKKYTIRFL